MSCFYRYCLRPFLFQEDSETIHNRTMAALGWIGKQPLLTDALSSFFGSPPLPLQLLGLDFPNPVGLAAGMDKLAEAVPTWEALGFGFSELGAVTWHAQPGNPPPRLFRVIPDEALINRMGFNNPGAEVVAYALARWHQSGRWPSHPVGVNLGKSKITPLENAPEDYAKSFKVLRPWLDFFVINVSSPNTPQLRQLQEKTALRDILAAVQELNAPRTDADAAAASPGPGRAPAAPKPVLVKVAPDLSFSALDEILELVDPCRIAGIVATNTTITRPQNPGPNLSALYAEPGGLSGRPLRERSTEVIRHLYRQSRGLIPIIGVGGIFNAADAWQKITAGAALVQVYTGLVYEGPAIARQIVSGLRRRMAELGLQNLSEAIGREDLLA